MHLPSRGLCGIDLGLQCFCIGAIEAVSSFSLVLVAIVRLCNPQNFIANWDVVSLDEDLKNDKLDSNVETSVELIVASGTAFIVSLLLIVGLRRKQTGLIYPWVIVMICQFAAGFIFFIVKISSRIMTSTEQNASSSGVASKIVAFIVYHIVMGYFIFSVFAYYNLLKRQKRARRNFLNLALSSEMVEIPRDETPHDEVDDERHAEEEQEQEDTVNNAMKYMKLDEPA